MFGLGSLVYKVDVDTAAATKNINSFDKKMSDTASSLKKVGGQLTKYVTLPIAGLGAVALKSAADFETANRKFLTAFKGSEEAAQSAVAAFSEGFGVAQSQATQLFAFTGDLLKGFGATADEALALTNQTNELAAALAAYNGVPVAQASEAATKALLGETESMKQLGVVIRQTDVDARLAAKGQGDLEGQARLLAKAQATLELAFEQSGDAVASFSDNQETLAFQTSALKADLQDLAVEFGQILIPVAKDLVEEIRGVVEWFGDLDDQTKENIVKAAALAAAIGPVISVVGGLTSAVRTLSLAFSGPVGLAVGIGLATVALIGFAKAKRDAKVEEYAEDVTDAARASFEFSDALFDVEEANFAVGRAFKNAMMEAQMFGTEVDTSLGSLDVIFNQLERDFGLTRTQVLLLVESAEEIPDVYRDALQPLVEQEKQLQETLKSELERADAISGQAENLERAAAAAEDLAADESVVTEELQAQADLRKQIEDKYIAARATVVGILQSERTEYENIQAQIDALEETKWASGGLEDDRLEAIQILRDQQQAILDEEVQARIAAEQEKTRAIQNINQENLARLYEQDLTNLERLEYNKQQELLAAEDTGANKALIEQYWDQQIQDEKDRLRDEEIEKERAKYMQIASFAGQFAGDIADLYRGITDAKVASVNKDAQEQINALDKQKLGEEEYNKQKEKIEKEAAQKEYEIKAKAYKSQQALDIAQTIFSTGLAAMRAYSSLAGIPIVGPILGAIAAAAAIAFGAVQIATIRNQPPPPKPAFAEGGIVSNPGAGIDAVVGEAGPEAILPLNDETLGNLGDAINESTAGTTSAGSTAGGGDLIINIPGLGTAVLKNGVQTLFDDRQVTLSADIIVPA